MSMSDHERYGVVNPNAEIDAEDVESITVETESGVVEYSGLVTVKESKALHDTLIFEDCEVTDLSQRSASRNSSSAKNCEVTQDGE